MKKILSIICIQVLGLGLGNVYAQSAKIDSLIASYVDVHQFNGTILVQQGRYHYQKSYGYQDYQQRLPISSESVFQIASLTKTFTSAIILKLIEQGMINLQDPLSHYLPYPDNGILIKHLLAQSSGIPDELDIPAIRQKFDDKEDLNAAYIESAIAAAKPMFAPGEKFNYSNSNYLLLGQVIEKVTGLTYEQALKKYITQPLKMQHTGLNFQALKSKNKTVPYAYFSTTKPRIASVENIAYTNAAGGIYSTIGDLYKYYEGLKNYQLFSRELFAQATNVQAQDTASDLYYGYGWFIDKMQGETVINHGGNLEGGTSSFFMVPGKDICIIALNNITSTTLERINSNVLAILCNKPYQLAKKPVAIGVADSVLQQYAGRYIFSDDYKVNISLADHVLQLKINDQPAIHLYAITTNSFLVEDDNLKLHFEKGDDGKLNLMIRDGLHNRSGEKE
ncbi:serine hydrolase domain-containing protein [Chitinophaga sp. Hz27]|uniref:serine hydrolase domain-containing protein n=1 Tax=Chitinophaga sp. Hz27 TaxID=3347169 RepID=UPI0035D9CDFC